MLRTPVDVWSAPNYGVTLKTTEVLPNPVKINLAGRRVERLPAWALSRPYRLQAVAPRWLTASCPDESWAYTFRDRFRALSAQWAAHPLSTIEAYSRSHIIKWVPEEGSAPGWYLPVDFATVGRLTATLNLKTLAWLRTLLDYPSAPPAAYLPVRLNTNHSDPTWGNTLDDHLCHMSMAVEAGTVGDITALAKEARGITGLALPWLPHLSTFSRTGPMAKPVPVYEWRDARACLVGSISGCYPRRRQVRGVPTWLNEVVRPSVYSAMWHLKRHEFYNHSGNNTLGPKVARLMTTVSKVNGAACSLLSDDISGYDLSVGPGLMSQLYDQVYADFPPMHRRVLSYMNAAPVLSGPLHEGDAAYSYDHEGGIVSGSLSTSLDGTMLNMGLVVEGVAHAMKWTISDAVARFERRSWHALIAGDDTLLFVPKSFDEQRYIDFASSKGFRRKLERFPVFLMTWCNPDGTEHGIAARAAMRTVTQEHRPAGRHAELLGCRMRWERALNDPLFYDCWNAISDNPLFADFGVKSFEDLRTTTNGSAFLTAFEEEVYHSPQGVERWARAVEGWTAGERASVHLNAMTRALLLRFGGLRALAATTEDGRTLLNRAANFNWRSYLNALQERETP